MDFVSELEKQCPSKKNLLNLRNSKAHTDFMQRWHSRQLPVYYQLRFKEIATQIEQSMEHLEKAFAWENKPFDQSSSEPDFCPFINSNRANLNHHCRSRPSFCSCTDQNSL